MAEPEDPNKSQPRHAPDAARIHPPGRDDPRQAGGFGFFPSAVSVLLAGFLCLLLGGFAAVYGNVFFAAPLLLIGAFLGFIGGRTTLMLMSSQREPLEIGSLPEGTVRDSLADAARSIAVIGTLSPRKVSSLNVRAAIDATVRLGEVVLWEAATDYKTIDSDREWVRVRAETVTAAAEATEALYDIALEGGDTTGADLDVRSKLDELLNMVSGSGIIDPLKPVRPHLTRVTRTIRRFRVHGKSNER